MSSRETLDQVVVLKASIPVNDTGEQEHRRWRVPYPFEFADMIAAIDDPKNDWPLQTSKYLMKYRDSEGDLCTLDPTTFTDFLGHGKGEDPKVFGFILKKKGSNITESSKKLAVPPAEAFTTC